jgi:hypothetical protein
MARQSIRKCPKALKISIQKMQFNYPTSENYLWIEASSSPILEGTTQGIQMFEVRKK